MCEELGMEIKAESKENIYTNIIIIIPRIKNDLKSLWEFKGNFLIYYKTVIYMQTTSIWKTKNRGYNKFNNF